MSLLSVRNLRTHFDTDDGVVKAVDDVSFEFERGKTLGIVGESGSGKSVTNLSIMRLVPSPPGRIVSGRSDFRRKGSAETSDRGNPQSPRKRIGMIFQDPMSSLNPFMRISRQLMEVTELHLGHSSKQARDHAMKMLHLVGIPDARARIDSYPHEFSGGMRQRVMIAMALSCRPELLIADEPTTALDVTIQAQILELIKKIKTEIQTSVILITHDLGVVAGMADTIIVMYAGRVFERASTMDFFDRPGNPYTKGLLMSVPDPLREVLPEARCTRFRDCRPIRRICRRDVRLRRDATWPQTFAGGNFHRWSSSRRITNRSATLRRRCMANPLISIRDLKVHFQTPAQVVQAVDGIDLDIHPGETVGLVGESGCGKSTMGRAILQTHRSYKGTVPFNDKDLAHLSHSEMQNERRHLQMIFQDPYASLDPRMTVAQILSEPLDTFRLYKGGERDGRIRELMETVGLSPRFIRRYPHEFSGGQQQRIGIARALAANPDFIVADEPISALDVSIQAQIMNLMERLRPSETSRTFSSRMICVPSATFPTA